MTESRKLDVLVVGGGILGLAIAALAAKHRFQVLLLRLRDHERPRADTLRNQSWLQSGLMYIERFSSDRQRGLWLAKRMFFSGRAMLNDLGLPLPGDSDTGVIRVKSVEEGARLVEDARLLKIANRVYRIDNREAEQRLSVLYEPNSEYYGIPDSPFDEATVLRRLREAALSESATLAQIPVPVTISHSGEGGSPCICLDGHEIPAYVTVLCAGAGNIPLLTDLGCETDYRIQRTPLKVLHSPTQVSVPIFADRERGFSCVRQPPAVAPPDGALVVGTRVKTNVPYCPPDERRIPGPELVAFRQSLPPALQNLPGRFTAGFEVLPSNQSQRSYLEPSIDLIYTNPYFLAASPGRATLAMSAAREALQKIVRLLPPPRTKGAAPALPHGTTPWEDDIHMHFEQQYAFCDAELAS